ncbi:hypothetical protein ATO21_05540 [Pediococcus acidilactici]|nr:hypothetical protein ATO21_05540 [Pediococcus acidilactici]
MPNKKKEDVKVHTLLGLNWGEWASITTIIVFSDEEWLVCFLSTSFFGPFQDDIKNLKTKIFKN